MDEPILLSTCGTCGDRYVLDTSHECWVLVKVNTQMTYPLEDRPSPESYYDLPPVWAEE